MLGVTIYDTIFHFAAKSNVHLECPWIAGKLGQSFVQHYYDVAAL